jgi:hypothetical protein
VVCLAGAVERVAEHRIHRIIPLKELGLVDEGRHLAAGRLLVAVENQGFCDWVVPLWLAGLTSYDVPLPGMEWTAQPVADPPVYLSWSSRPTATPTLAAPRFSTYAHALAWDSVHISSRDRNLFPPPHLTAVDGVPIRDQDLAVLREQFVVGPRTYGWAGNFGDPDLTIHRFDRPGQRVWVATHPEQTEWLLSADSAASLAALTDLLARANQALVRQMRQGRVWTNSGWAQTPDPGTPPDHSG